MMFCFHVYASYDLPSGLKGTPFNCTTEMEK